MTIFNPELVELMNEIKKPPMIPTLKSFSEIVDAMRTTHAVLMINRTKFEQIYADAVKSGKLSASGLREMKEEFESAYNSSTKLFRDLLSSEIDKWKNQEQNNAFEVVNKAPSDEQSRALDAIVKRETVSQAEIELWAKNFEDNYLCASAFRDFAKSKGFYVFYSDFTDAEERIKAITDSYERLNSMLKSINQLNNDMSYLALSFYGTDENGNYFKGWSDNYSAVLDSDSTFKPKTIKVEPISSHKDAV